MQVTMRIDAPTAARPVSTPQQAYQPYAVASSYGTSAVSAPAYQQDSFVPTGYATGENVVYGQAKNMGLRFMDKTLNLRTPYMEAALIDKTPHNPMDIEEIDFNLRVKSAQVGVTDVDTTITITNILNESAAKTGKPS